MIWKRLFDYVISGGNPLLFVLGSDKISVSGVLKRGGKVYTPIIQDTDLSGNKKRNLHG